MEDAEGMFKLDSDPEVHLYLPDSTIHTLDQAKTSISNIRKHFSINCDSSHLAETIYKKAEKDLFGFMKKNEASHYHRLMGFGLEKDIRY